VLERDACSRVKDPKEAAMTALQFLSRVNLSMYIRPSRNTRLEDDLLASSDTKSLSVCLVQVPLAFKM